MYSEYSRTSGAETGTTTGERTLARARLALSARGTMCTSRLCETKSEWRSPSAWPTRMPVSANKDNKNRSLRCSVAARTATICSGSKVRGAWRGTCSFTGRTGMGFPLVTWCKNGLYEPRDHPPPGHQLGGHPEAGPGVVVVEAENPGQVAVHRGRPAYSGPIGQHHHVGRRGAQPGHEAGHVLDAHLLPADLGPGQELEPQLQADGVGPHGIGRALDGGQVGQVTLGRLDHLAVVAEQCPGLGTAPRHEHPLDEHDLETNRFKPTGGGPCSAR